MGSALNVAGVQRGEGIFLGWLLFPTDRCFLVPSSPGRRRRLFSFVGLDFFLQGCELSSHSGSGQCDYRQDYSELSVWQTVPSPDP